MSFLDKLKALFNIELNAPLINYVNIRENSNNQQNSKDGFYHDKDNGKVELYLDTLPTDKKQGVKEIVKEYIGEGNKLLEENTLKLLYKLHVYNKEKKEDAQVLNFFKPIIPPNDFEALEASLYLRQVFSRREDVNKLKRDIRKRFGDRGNNIANLCTAGYFEQFLMPLYNSSKEKFNELYEIIVSKSVVALFVHSLMNQDDITREISNRLQISSKYGIKFIHIHGIGTANVDKIKECLEEQKNFFGFFPKEIYEKDNIIIVELLLK